MNIFADIRTLVIDALAAMVREGVAVHVQLGDAARAGDRPMVSSRSGQVALLRTLLRAAAETTHRGANSTQERQVPQGTAVGPCSQLRARARIRALDVLPQPRGPLNR